MPVKVTAAFGILLALVLALSGHAHLATSPDTESYLRAAYDAVPLGQMRLPVYGWLLRVLDPTVLLWTQLAAFGLAALWLVRALQLLGLSRAACLSVGVALIGSDVVLLWGTAAIPEMLGHAALLAALAITVEIAAGRSLGWRIVVAAIATCLAWSLRPSLLPFAVLLPCLVWLLPRRRKVIGPMLWLLFAGMAPVLCLSAVREAELGDFNVVSFGGFQMSGMAALMLTPELAERLSPADRAAAHAIIDARAALVANGRAIGMPANSTGQRSFRSAALGYFDILARTHDTVLYEAVGPLRGPDESWVAFNRRMQHLALATIIADPIDYAAWVIGATARLVGHAIVLNAMFVLSTGALKLVALLRQRAWQVSAPDLHAMLALSAIYLLGTCPLIVLTTFPAERYIDSAGMMLPIWPLYALLRITGQRALRITSAITPPAIAAST